MDIGPAEDVSVNNSEFISPKLRGDRRLVRPQPQTRSFLSVFTLERFKKNPDLYRQRIAVIVEDQIRHAEATSALLRYLEPELCRQERQLGYLNIKCRTLYERLRFVRELRQNAESVLRNFDLFIAKNVEDAVSVAPPLLKNAVHLYQIRWRNAIASNKWQKDVAKAKQELAYARERYKNGVRDLELKRTQLEMYKKICAIKNEFTGLSEEEKLRKIESVLSVTAPHLLEKKWNNVSRIELRRSLSDNSLTSKSSDEWDDWWTNDTSVMDHALHKA